jgi:hypothetical protein
MAGFRVTCWINLPDMFASELCIFTDEAYFNEHTSAGQGRFGKKRELIQGKSLDIAWGLKIPEGFSEIGILRTDINDEGNPYISECWFIGEVQKVPNPSLQGTPVNRRP